MSDIDFNLDPKNSPTITTIDTIITRPRFNLKDQDYWFDTFHDCLDNLIQLHGSGMDEDFIKRSILGETYSTHLVELAGKIADQALLEVQARFWISKKLTRKKVNNNNNNGKNNKSRQRKK